MLRLAGICAIPPEPRIEFVYGFSIWWNELRDVQPKSWWTINTPANYLMIEVHTQVGTLTSIECPLLGTVKAHESALWTLTDVTEGHPVFEPTLPPWKKVPEPGFEKFDFNYSPSDVAIRWGTAVRAIRTGRCMFGLDARDDLVCVGLVEMTEPEYGRLRYGVGAGRYDMPIEAQPDWQLSAVLSVMSEQIEAAWYPGPKETNPDFIRLKERAAEIEREIERRLASR